jgi:hypothetical protein
MNSQGFRTQDSRFGVRGSGGANDVGCPAHLWVGLVIVALFLAQACSPKPVSGPAAFFPQTNEVPGWSKAETRTFEADRLWEYIDGDADRYIQAGVERTLTTDYRYHDKVEAVADIYVMKAPEGARKIFDSESSVGSQPAQIGEDGRLFPASLTFRKGPCFVRLTAYQETPEVGKALVELGRGIERRLRG